MRNQIKRINNFLKDQFSLGLHPVPDDNQLSDHLLRVHRQIHSRLRSSGVRADTSLLPRVREPAAGHGEAWTELSRRAGRVREPLHRRSRLWELRYIRHGRLGFLLAGKPFIWSLLALINGAAGCWGLSQAHLSSFLCSTLKNIPAFHCRRDLSSYHPSSQLFFTNWKTHSKVR